MPLARLRREGAALLAALGYFTRCPLPAGVLSAAPPLADAARYLPLIGLLIGGLGAAVFLAAQTLWPAPVAVFLALAATLLATGALHEDGLADTADGLGGGWDRERILAIMKDSRLGSFGAIALVLALGGKFILLAALAPALVPAALVAGHCLSRFFACLLMYALPYARSGAADGPENSGASKAAALVRSFGAGSLAFAALWALAGGLALSAVLPLPGLLGGLLLAGLSTLWLGRKLQRWLGGQTGDCLGAAQQLAEIALYLGLLAQP